MHKLKNITWKVIFEEYWFEEPHYSEGICIATCKITNYESNLSDQNLGIDMYQKLNASTK